MPKRPAGGLFKLALTVDSNGIIKSATDVTDPEKPSRVEAMGGARIVKLEKQQAICCWKPTPLSWKCVPCG